MAATIGLAFRRHGDAEAGGVVTALVGFGVMGCFAFLSLPWHGDVWPFLLAGILAPGASQLLYVRSVQEIGPARASVVVGAAPLVSVTIAILVLDEPLSVALLVGAGLIVAGGLALAGERRGARAALTVGVVLALGSTLFFATRDNVVRALADDTAVDPQLAAATTTLSGLVVMLVYLSAIRGRRMIPDVRAAFRPFALPGIFWGLSYAALFEAFYRGRVSVVSPLVATEALFGVIFATILLGRTELVGRHVVTGAVLVVTGGILIGVFR
jgi:drug/metabolite transporter (DMT)-like permease